MARGDRPEQDGGVRGWQVGAVGACVVGAVALLGQAAWAQVVTPQPWPGVVGPAIVVTADQTGRRTPAPDARAVDPTLTPTADATATSLPDPPEALSTGGTGTAAQARSASGGSGSTADGAHTSEVRTTVAPAPQVVSPDRVREVEAPEHSTDGATSGTPEEKSDRHESAKDDD